MSGWMLGKQHLQFVLSLYFCGKRRQLNYFRSKHAVLSAMNNIKAGRRVGMEVIWFYFQIAWSGKAPPRR